MKKIFKWPGGKGREIKRVLPLMPQGYKTIVEPFSGSAALSFFLEKDCILNDLDRDIYNFYNVVKDDQDFVDLMAKIHHAKSIPFVNKDSQARGNVYSLEDEYYKQRNVLNARDFSDPVEMAYAFFVTRQLSFSGMLRYNDNNGNFNVPYGWYKKISNNLTNDHHDFLKNKVTITKEDYRRSILNNDNKDTFIFVDPPYRNREGYPVGAWDDIDHKTLFGVLDQIQHAKWLLVHCEDPLYNSLYSKFNIKLEKYNYNIEFKSRNKQQRKTNHMYITNY